MLLFYDFSGMCFERLMPYSSIFFSLLSNKILVYQKRKKKKIYPQFLQFNKGSFDTLNENYYNIGNFLTNNKMCCYKIIKHHYKKRGFRPRLKNAAIAPKNAAIGYSRVFYSRVYKRGLNTAARGL